MTFFLYRKCFRRTIIESLTRTRRFVLAVEKRDSYETRDPWWQDRSYLCSLYDLERIMQRDCEIAKWATLSEIDELREFYQFPSFAEWRNN